MQIPKNLFKAALAEGRQTVGIWNTINGPSVPELLATTGFEWVLIDCEHTPINTADVQPALQSMAAYPEVSPVVRPAANDPVLFKRILDMGAQTLLVPYVQSADEARAAVSAMRYPPEGIRGMAGMSRATRYGTVENYFAKAQDELCLVVQVESVEAMNELEDIAAIDGVDAVFIGPSDLSASMGLAGQVRHPKVVAAIEDAIDRLKAVDVPSGVLMLEPTLAKQFLARGATFAAVAYDQILLANAAREARALF